VTYHSVAKLFDGAGQDRGAADAGGDDTRVLGAENRRLHRLHQLARVSRAQAATVSVPDHILVFSVCNKPANCQL